MSHELVGIIGGTGLGEALVECLSGAQPHDIETPFGRPSCEILVGTLGGKEVAFLNRHGTGHRLSPTDVPYAANIFALKKLGVRTIISSGAVGSLREQIEPADLVLVDQFIDKTFKRTNTFFGRFGAVHCEMSEPVCGRVREILLASAPAVSVKTHSKGTYICMEGPQFSTRAESHMHRSWGADLIGMTAMPEVKLAREAQICYAMVALPSDYDCWKSHEGSGDKQTLLEEIIGNLHAATQNCIRLVTAVLQSDRKLVCEDCACRRSLDLAVWTDRSCIDASERQALNVLFE